LLQEEPELDIPDYMNNLVRIRGMNREPHRARKNPTARLLTSSWRPDGFPAL